MEAMLHVSLIYLHLWQKTSGWVAPRAVLDMVMEKKFQPKSASPHQSYHIFMANNTLHI